MTRDEAIALVDKAVSAGWDKLPIEAHGQTKHIILTLEALGLIKFDEPAKITGYDAIIKVAKAWVGLNTMDAAGVAHDVVTALLEHGYKIVKDEPAQTLAEVLPQRGRHNPDYGLSGLRKTSA